MRWLIVMSNCVPSSYNDVLVIQDYSILLYEAEYNICLLICLLGCKFIIKQLLCKQAEEQQNLISLYTHCQDPVPLLFQPNWILVELLVRV